MFIFQYFLDTKSCIMSVEDYKLKFITVKDIILEPNAVATIDLVMYTKTPMIPNLSEVQDLPVLIAPHIIHHPHMAIEGVSINNQTNREVITRHH